MKKIECNKITASKLNIQKLYKTLADTTRLRILSLILNSKQICVCQITAVLNLTQSNVSNHLDKLKQSSIVKSFKKNKFIYYERDEIFITKHKKLYDSILYSLNFIDSYENDLSRLEKCPDVDVGCCDVKHIKKEIDKYLKQNIKIINRRKKL